MQFSSQYEPGEKPHYLDTFDNHSTTEQMILLANVAKATGRDDCKAAFVKGLDFIFAAQDPNGGWRKSSRWKAATTTTSPSTDDAMTHVLELLQTVTSDDPDLRLRRCRPA